MSGFTLVIAFTIILFHKEETLPRHFRIGAKFPYFIRIILRALSKVLDFIL